MQRAILLLIITAIENAHSTPRKRVLRLDDQQHVVQRERLQLAGKQLRLRLSKAQFRQDDQAVLADQLAQHRTDAGAVHLAVDLLREVLVGGVRADLAAAIDVGLGVVLDAVVAGCRLALVARAHQALAVSPHSAGAAVGAGAARASAVLVGLRAVLHAVVAVRRRAHAVGADPRLTIAALRACDS